MVDVLDELSRRFAQAAERGYIGEPVSQLEHALQSAALATDARAPDVEIAAALLHDVGHLCAPPGAATMDGYGVRGHEQLGATYLRELGFKDEVAALVAGHVEAKRYLVAAHAAYAARLSAASVETLRHQGGPMTAAEVVAFERDPWREAKLRLRAWDDQAKRVGWVVPEFSTYLALLARQLL